MTASRNWKENSWLHIAILLVTIVVAYNKIFTAGFMSWDDAGYVLDNADIRQLDADHISLWFKNFYIGNYHPLTIATYAIDYAVGGYDPFVYHLMNILFHCINAVLVYGITRRLFDVPFVALLVAIIFAIHPVQTETVAWVAERKNVLYGLFYLLAIWCYISYATEDNKWSMAWVVLCAIAAMLSKVAAITLPFALFGIDIWLQRPLRDKKIWLEKLPLVAIAIAFGWVGMQAQREGEFLNLHPELSFLQTILFAGYAYSAYLVHLFVPVKLSVLYPYPKEIGVIHILGCISTAAILFAAWWSYRRRLFVLVGAIVFYTVNIALVLQFVQFGEVLMADRYLYIPCVGVWVAVVYYLYVAAQKYNKQIAVSIVGIGAAIMLTALTYTRNHIWLSELNFWTAIVETFPSSSVAQNSIGGVYMKMGDYPQALQHVDMAVHTDPANYKAWYNKGAIHLRTGEIAFAAGAFDKAIAINEYPKALFSRALLLQQSGQPQRAMNDIEKVLAKDGTNARAYFIKASCMDQMGNIEGAIANYSKAIEYDSKEPIFYVRRGAVLVRVGYNSEAVADLSSAIALKNNMAEAWYWRGMAKHNLNRDACGDLNEARKLGSKEAVDALMKFCNQY